MHANLRRGAEHYLAGMRGRYVRTPMEGILEEALAVLRGREPALRA